MKRRTLILILVLEAVLIAGLVVLTRLFPDLFTSVFAFPMEQIAAGLNALADTGAVGNGAALVLLAAVALVPSVFALRTPRGRETLAERITLVILSVVLVVVFLEMIHPTVFRNSASPDISRMMDIYRSVLSFTVWSVLVLYIVLRLIRLFRAGNREQLLRHFRIIASFPCMYFTAEFVAVLADGVLTFGDGNPTGADGVVRVFRIAADAVPPLFEIAVLLRVRTLLEIASTEEQEGLVEAAGRVSSLSCITLAVTAGLCVLKHIVQFPFLPDLTNFSATVEIPLASIIFTAVILLFSRLLAENKTLREDNGLFI